VHETGYPLGGIGVSVELDTLDEAARAVPDASDRDTDFVTDLAAHLGLAQI